MPEPTELNGLSAGYGRAWVRARGVYVVGVLLVGALVLLGWREFDRAASSSTAEHTRLLTAQHKLAEEIGVLSYLLSLPPDERPRLMPPPGFWERVEREPRRRAR